MKLLEINGIAFECTKSHLHPVAPITTGCNRNEIHEVYDRPSHIKELIWYEWCNWCDQLNANGAQCGIEISSHNCNFFSISGSLRINGKCYGLWITRAHNRIYEYEEI